MTVVASRASYGSTKEGDVTEGTESAQVEEREPLGDSTELEDGTEFDATEPDATEPDSTEPDSTEPDEAPRLDVHALPGGLRAAVEAVLMVVDEPVTSASLASALEVPEADIDATIAALAEDYVSTERGFDVRQIAGGWRIYSRHDLAPVIERFLLDGRRSRITQAALETLAVIAYRQPISRARVSAVRGVNVDGVVRTLMARGLITEVGMDAEHGAVLYGTTDYFLQRIGVGSLSDLPPLAPYLPELDTLDGLDEELA